MMFWTCCKCGVTWPKYTTIDAYRARLKANEVHPGEDCSSKLCNTDQLPDEPDQSLPA